VSGEGAPRSVRLFFAVWPPAALQAQLAQAGIELQQSLGGKSTRAESIHLTLLFLDSVDAARLPAVEALGDGVRCPRFALPIERRGAWKHNGVAWVGPEVTPAPLAALAAGLQAGARALGFEVDERPYHAHLTLLRKTRRPLRPESLGAPLSWPVDEFVLVRSELGGPASRYSILRRYPCIE
jgi:2'-5' RNA ligase